MTKELLEQLEIAKKNVRELLENGNLSIDMHGLKYWAGVVERLREEIKREL